MFCANLCSLSATSCHKSMTLGLIHPVLAEPSYFAIDSHRFTLSKLRREPAEIVRNLNADQIVIHKRSCITE